MNKQDLIQKHGFRPGTREDFMEFSGAPDDALFKRRDFESEVDPNAGCVCTYSESEGSCHFYISIDTDQFGKIFHGPDRLVALACAAASDEWINLAIAAITGRPLGQLDDFDQFLSARGIAVGAGTGHDWKKALLAVGFNDL